MEPQRYNHLNKNLHIQYIHTIKLTSIKAKNKAYCFKSFQLLYKVAKNFGKLVLLSCDVTTYTPVAYLGRRLQPPYMDI